MSDIVYNYKNHFICIERDGEVYHTEIKTSIGKHVCRFLMPTIPDCIQKSYEIIDFDMNGGIIEDMNVTKPHMIQIGDIVSVRVPPNSKKVRLGIVERIDETIYSIAYIRQVDSYYQKIERNVPHQLGDLSLYPNRVKWVEIKRDLDRRKSGEVLLDWLETL